MRLVRKTLRSISIVMKVEFTIEGLFIKIGVSYETGVKGEFKKENSWEFVPSVSFKLEMLLGGT